MDGSGTYTAYTHARYGIGSRGTTLVVVVTLQYKEYIGMIEHEFNLDMLISITWYILAIFLEHQVA